MNPSHLPVAPWLMAALAVLGPSSSARAQQPKEARAEAKLDFDMDLDEVMDLAQEQLEAAQEQVSESTDQVRRLAQKDIEEARKRASEQMEVARRHLDEARRQWQKQIEEARKQMQVAASSIRAVAQRERLTGAYGRLGIVPKPPVAGASSAGTVVQAVTPGSPGEKAGIAAGDVITAIDGQRLPEAGDAGTDDGTTSRIAKLLRRGKSGESIEIEYRRGGETKKAKVQLEPRRWGHASYGDHRSLRAVRLPGGWLSLELAEINPGLGEYFGASRGLLVIHAATSADVQLQPGDVILKIGDEEPSSPKQAVRLLRSYEPGQSVPIEILRQKKKQTLALRIPPAPSDRP